jgi:hypothetical protein
MGKVEKAKEEVGDRMEKGTGPLPGLSRYAEYVAGSA